MMTLRHAVSRRFLATGALAAALLTALPAGAAPDAGVQSPASQAPRVYSMTLGEFTVTALSDGSVRIPLDKLLIGTDKNQIDRILTDQGLEAMAETPINAFLIQTGKQLVLVDTGAGESLGTRGGGKLPDSLRAAGFRPEDIDAILLTHIHGDHSNGLTVKGKAVFPNARVYVERRDAGLWLDAGKRTTIDARHAAVFDEAAAAFAPYLAAGKVTLFDAGAEVVPGVRSVVASGHTPGHVVYQIASKGKTLRFLGDLIHAEKVQFAKPQVAILFDVDPSAARSRRATLFDDAATQAYLTATAHVAFPGIGWIERRGEGFGWRPVGEGTASK